MKCLSLLFCTIIIFNGIGSCGCATGKLARMVRKNEAALHKVTMMRKNKVSRDDVIRQ